MKKGILIGLVGIDGCGKTTQAQLLLEQAERMGVSFSYVWCRWKPVLLRPLIKLLKRKGLAKGDSVEQGYKTMKEYKNKLFNNPFLRASWLVMFFFDYSLQIMIKIRPVLFLRKYILSDRIFFDSIIDQAVNLGNRKELLFNKLDSWWMKVLFPRPQLVIFIDCPAETAFLRKKDAPNIGYLEERRKLYSKLANRYQWIKIDGTLSVEDINIQIREAIDKTIGIKNG